MSVKQEHPEWVVCPDDPVSLDGLDLIDRCSRVMVDRIKDQFGTLVMVCADQLVRKGR